MAAASRNSTPLVAALPVATITDIGVASPRAQGQAMISTATALIRPYTQLGSGPHRPQPKKVSTAMAITTMTNQPAITSARRCIGALERCAWATICTICASMVALPTFCACITRLPWRLRVAPISVSPARFITGTGSPVSIDSSTALSPSSTRPSTGTFSPGRTRSLSPLCTWVSGMSSSLPSALIRRAVFGARPSSDLIAAEVCERARSSSIWPSRVSEMITAAAS
ncbi:hypothetical protein SSTU70S_02859 [Stutzerimonas stutzeri]